MERQDEQHDLKMGLAMVWRSTRRLRSRQLLLACLCLLAAAGCQQAGLYQASSLPPQFAAPRYGNLQNVDLSQLAQATSNSQVLYPGDVVEVSIVTGIEKGTPAVWKGRVTDDGAINVPLVGPVVVAGLELTQAELAVRSESIRRGKYISPNVSVILTQRRTNRITVVGAVEEPGTHELPASSCDVLSSIVMAGGLSEEAGTIVEIRRPPRQVTPASYNGNVAAATPPRAERIDLEQVAVGQQRDYRLEDGSTVMVMKKPKRFVHVIGLVKKSGQYEMPTEQELRLLDAIALGGGRTLELADKVHIIRRAPGQSTPVVIQASVRAAKRDNASNIRLAASDVISVEETTTTFVVGTVREFIRFGFSAAIPGL
ncbi:MAG: hypothetical protein CMJ62_12925 [Planctomycetaceae bacterium]|nr:hypothetical protein [Planctomycetaceae bacterium]